MDITEMAVNFTNAVREDRADEYKAYWSDNIVSIEPGEGEMARVEGREALEAKHAWWEANAEVHDVTTVGPFVNGNQFAVNYAMDVTMDGERSQMKEVGLYTVEDGKIVEEAFLYGTPG